MMRAPNLGLIIVSVLAVHVGVLFYLSRDGATVPHGRLNQEKNRVAVRTYVMSTFPSPPPVQQEVVVRAEPKKINRPKTEPQIKAKPKPKEKPTKSDETIKRVQAQLAQLREAPASKGTQQEATAILPTLGSFQVTAPVEKPAELGYEEDLVLRLRTLLRLPEYGQVTVHLTVLRDGSVKHVEVVSAESVPNRLYVEKHLPRCKLAEFGRRFGEDVERSFTVVLSNAL